MNTIILTGGGTAGHIMPNIALLPKLKTYFNRIVYIGSFNGMEKQMIQSYPEIEFYPITTVKFARKFTLSNLKIPFLLHKGIKEAEKLIKEIKPNVIFSKGGFVSVPVVWAGSKHKIPIVMHESDFSLGLANRISKNKANCILTTFPQTASLLKNGIYVGSPVKENIFICNKSKIKEQLNIQNNIPILLIIGGSLGSEKINNMVWENINYLTNNFFIIHLTGKNKLNKSITSKNYIQMEYYDKIEELFNISDFAITRGGSNTIWELFALKIPMIIIPLSKKISRGDQIQNALYFEKHNYGLAILEDELTNTLLKNKLNILIENKQKFKEAMIKNSNENALQKIFEYICNFTKKQA